MSRHRLKHRLTLVQDIELPPELAGKDLEAFLFAERKRMVEEVNKQLTLRVGTLISEPVITHPLRSVTPGRNFELMM